MGSVGNIFLAVIMALSIFGQGHFDIFSHTSNAEKSITLKFEAADHHHGLVEVVGSLSHHHDLGDDSVKDCGDVCCVFGCQSTTGLAYFSLMRSISPSVKIIPVSSLLLHGSIQTTQERPPRFV
jgi:hypothetical protein